jgi:hypothetical protein
MSLIAYTYDKAVPGIPVPILHSKIRDFHYVCEQLKDILKVKNLLLYAVEKDLKTVHPIYNQSDLDKFAPDYKAMLIAGGSRVLVSLLLSHRH